MIRPATFADVPGLRRLFAALVADLEATHGPLVYPQHHPDDLDSFTLWAARRLEHDPACVVYVATDDATGELVGFLGGEISERALGEPRVYGAAHWLYIMPTHRGRGVARALVTRGVADMEALGVTHVELAARAGDAQWQARGWVPFLVHHALPLAAIVASVTDRPAPAPEAAPVSDPARRPIADLELSARPARCFDNLGIRYVDELVHMTARDLLSYKNFGRRSLTEVREALFKLGLCLEGERRPSPRLIAGGRA